MTSATLTRREFQQIAHHTRFEAEVLETSYPPQSAIAKSSRHQRFTSRDIREMRPLEANLRNSYARQIVRPRNKQCEFPKEFGGAARI